MITDDRWLYCRLCKAAVIVCEYCKNCSCSGGGCDLCFDEFEEAIKRSGRGEHPSIDTLPLLELADWELP
jgi:hypothetical protein